MRVALLFFSALEAFNIFSHLGSIFTLFLLYKNIAEFNSNFNVKDLLTVFFFFCSFLIVFIFSTYLISFFKKNRGHWLLLRVRPHFLSLKNRRVLRINFKSYTRMLASVILLVVMCLFFLTSNNQSFLCSILLFTAISTCFMFSPRSIRFVFLQPRSLLQVYSLSSIIAFLIMFKFIFASGSNFFLEMGVIYCLRIFIVDYIRAILFFLVNTKNLQL